MFRAVLFAGAGALLLLAGCTTPETPSMTQAGMAMAPSDYVTAAAQSDMFEIQEGQLAASRGKDGRVRSFGQMMVTDHTRTSQALMSAAAASHLPAPATALRPDQQDMVARLQAASGSEFDRMYVTQQVQAHQEALSLQTAYAQGGADPNLKATASAAVPVIQQHLDTVRQMQQGMGG